MLLKKLDKKSVTKVSAIDASGFVLKTQYNTDKSGLKKMTLTKQYLILVDLLKTQIKMQRSLRLKVKYLVLLACLLLLL